MGVLSKEDLIRRIMIGEMLIYPKEREQIAECLPNSEDAERKRKEYFKKLASDSAKLSWRKVAIKDYIEKNFLYKDSDDIKKDPRKVVKNIYRFLRLKNFSYIPKSLNSKPNAASNSRFPYLNRLMIQTEYFLLRNKLHLLHQLLEDTNFRKFAFNTTYFKNRKPLKKYPKIKRQTEEKLKEFFKPDITKLEKLINRDLKVWK